MTKQKFLNGLKEALVGEVSPAEVNNQLLYYERYIDDEIKKGRTEQQILEELGEPRLIAKTIVDAKENIYRGREAYYYQEGETSQPEEQRIAWNEKNNRVLRIILILLLVLFGIAVIFSVIRILLPIVVPAILILVVLSFIQRKR